MITRYGPLVKLVMPRSRATGNVTVVVAMGNVSQSFLYEYVPDVAVVSHSVINIERFVCC